MLPSHLVTQLQDASIVTRGGQHDGHVKSEFRVSDLYLPDVGADSGNLDKILYFHSAFPTKQDDAVFFGPDTYFFLKFLAQTSKSLLPSKPRTVVDVCCGSGAGAIHVARDYPQSHVLGLDLNPKALRLGKINAKLADCRVEFGESNLFAAVESRDDIDLIVSNPPYIASGDEGVPMYAAGGAQQGLALPLRIVEEGVRTLAENGVLMIYTGVPIPFQRPGYDPFLEQIRKIDGAELVSYKIIHPDMFGEELTSPAYADTGRIQVVGAILRRKTR